jgi:hypothetical protein
LVKKFIYINEGASMESKKTKRATPKDYEKEITPKKDFHIVHNEYDIQLVEGVAVSIPAIFLENMKTEGVI